VAEQAVRKIGFTILAGTEEDHVGDESLFPEALLEADMEDARVGRDHDGKQPDRDAYHAADDVLGGIGAADQLRLRTPDPVEESLAFEGFVGDGDGAQGGLEKRGDIPHGIERLRFWFPQPPGCFSQFVEQEALLVIALGKAGKAAEDFWERREGAGDCLAGHGVKMDEFGWNCKLFPHVKTASKQGFIK